MFAFSDQSGGLYLEDAMGDEDNPASGWERTEKITRKIGSQVAQNAQVFNAILPELVSVEGQRLLSFGQGLADGFSDHGAAWTSLIEQLRVTSPKKRGFRVLLGFLSVCAEINPAFYSSIMDGMVKDDLLAEWFPIFQASTTDYPRCIERLHESLDFGRAPANQYQHLAWGRAHEPINDVDLAALLEKLILKEGGVNVAIEILTMRFHGKEKSSARQSQSLVFVAYKIHLSISFSRADRTRNDGGYRLANLVEMFLPGPGGAQAAEVVCRNLAQAIISGAVYAFDYPLLLKSFASVQPVVFLNVFLGQVDENSHRLQRMFSRDYERRENPLNQISDDDIITWCEASPEERYPVASSWIDGFSSSNDQSVLKWKPIVHTLFEKAPSLDKILDELEESIRPSGWSGSLADILQERVVLFESLFFHENSQISAWARKCHDHLKESIRNQRETEEKRNRERNESFE